LTGTLLDQDQRRFDGPAIVRNAGDGALLWSALILALIPVIYLVASSFNVADLGRPYAFGLDNWAAALTSSGTVRAIGNTLVLSTRVIFAFVAALAISWAIVRLDIPGRRFVEASLWVAFFLPSVPVAMAWILLLHRDYGLINLALQHVPFLPKHMFSIHSMAGIMWVYVTIATTPFLTIVFTPVFRRMDAAFEEVARVNGASRLQTMLRIVLPTLFPALIIGLLATFVRSLESFEVEQLVGAPARIFVFTTRIYDLTREDPPLYNQAMTLGTLFLAIVLVLAALQVLYLRRHPTSVTASGRSARVAISARPGVRAAAGAIAIGFVIITIYLPLAMLLIGSCTKVFDFFGMHDPWTAANWFTVLTDDRFLRATRNSFVFGLGVAIVAVPLYLRLAFIIARASGSRQGALASVLIWLPWAVPGFAFGLAILDLLLRVGFLAPFYGTAAPIVFAMLIKEMPVGVQLLRVAVEQHGREFEDAAAVAGAARWQTLRRITLPMLSPTLSAVFIIVFAGVMKEIGTIVMLSGPGTETLSMLMFDYANEGHKEAAAVIGVLFAVGSAFLAMAVSRRIVLTGPQ
jgi:iron(III) transport system permease protein